MSPSVLLVAALALAAPPDEPAEAKPELSEQGEPQSAPAANELQELRAQISALTQLVASQQAQLDELRAPPPTTHDQLLVGDVTVGPSETANFAVSLWGDVDVYGHVLGDVQAVGGDVLLHPSAVVDGDAVSLGGEIQLQPGSTLRGDRVALRGFSLHPAKALSAAAAFYHRVVSLLTLLGGGLLTLALFPRRVELTAQTIEAHPVRSPLVGSVIAGFLTVGALLFAITLIGVPVSLLLLAALAAAGGIGWTALATLIGQRLLQRSSPSPGWPAFTLGFVVLAAVTQIPTVGELALILGTGVVGGAALLSRLGTRSPR